MATKSFNSQPVDTTTAVEILVTTNKPTSRLSTRLSGSVARTSADGLPRTRKSAPHKAPKYKDWKTTSYDLGDDE